MTNFEIDNLIEENRRLKAEIAELREELRYLKENPTQGE